jgi:FAD/FMN-containing dehydrogenase
MKGIEIHDSFKPKKCSHTISTSALTLQAGSQMGEINLAASKRNLSILSGGGSTVGVGGYLTGGGHAALSATYGLAADHVLEIQLVTPTGEIVTANECQHQDLFWAMRGGGGSTFGIITSVTIAAFPAVPHITVLALAGTAPNTDAYWSAMAYIFSQFPGLSDQGISAYTFVYPDTTYQGSKIGAFQGIFSIPQLTKHNTTASLKAALSPIFDHINTMYPGQFQYSLDPVEYPSFYDWWKVNNGPNNAGADILAGSRLLSREVLAANVTKLKEALKAATPPLSGSQLYLVGGKGVRDVIPRGGGDAVLPAWRDSLVHMGWYSSAPCGCFD